MPLPELTSVIASDYSSVKKLVSALEADKAIVLLALALDPAARPIRTSSVLQDAQVLRADGSEFGPKHIANLVAELIDEGLVVSRDRREVVNPAIELALTMTAYARFAEAGKRIAEAMLLMLGYAQVGASKAAVPVDRSNRDWKFVYDYDGFPLKTRLLLLANRAAEFAAHLADIAQYHEWRIPARKAEAQAAASEVFLYFNYSFFRHLATPLRLKAFDTAVNGKAHWSELTAVSIVEFLCDTSIDATQLEAYHEANFGFGASLAMHRFAKAPRAHHLRTQLCVAAAQGHWQEATSFAERHSWLADHMAGMADILAVLLLLRQDQKHLLTLADRVVSWKNSPQRDAVAAVQAFVQWSLGNGELCEKLLSKHFAPQKQENDVDLLPKAPPVAWMVALWTYAWTGFKPHGPAVDALLQQFFQSGSSGQVHPVAYQPYVRGEIMNALVHVLPGDPRAKRWREEADRLAARHEFHYLLGLHSVPEAWEYALRVIDTVASGRGSNNKAPKPDARLIWTVDFEQQELIAREQKRGKRGWSKGRQLSLVELIEHAASRRFDAEDDRAIGAATRWDGRPVTLGQRYGADVKLDFGRALYHLDGHPRLYLDDSKRIPLEVRRVQPHLHVDETGADVRLSFSPPGAHSEGYYWEKETPTRYRIYQISAEQARLARAIGQQIVIPTDKRELLQARLESLRDHVAVHAINEQVGEDLLEVMGDTRPCAQLLPYGVAYKLELYARPLPGQELYLPLGEGLAKSVVTRSIDEPLEDEDELPGERTDAASEQVLLTRDLAAEKRAAEQMIADCPSLQALGHDQYEWTLDDNYAALRVLLELRSLQQEERITVEHPKGEKLRLVGSSAADSLRIQIRKDRDWFEVSGKVTTDEGKVVGFRQLLAHLRNGGGEFVELGEGEFMAITAELRARLEAMEGMLQERAGGVQLATLAAPAFAELVDDLDELEVDEAWRQNLARIKASEDFEPTLPLDFRGELRDYQVIGYRWLRRLAEWGVGGCLADDMGLGKTVQALALLVARQARGPALVIAPASVTRNWMLETARFAPQLSPKLLATSSDVHMLNNLEAGDVLLVSYGLLTFVEQQLLQSAFATIILDEAQAIKNPATKRAKLIFQLEGELRIATTGTPIENHLGELWSLFRFLNPGLLGSRQHFNEKYAGPIRREGNVERAEALRKLVRPFVLRRRKEEVLKELPPKTEVNLAVELSDDEMALYEALRREAVEAIDDASPNAQRMIVLQQLTRLRQAACHPRLVRPKSKLASAKLELVGETILELLDNGHQALVFSQFVRHLKLVEAWVQAAGIRYCYLDGSTPGGKRQKQVEAFQNGEADIFLISLKAGGTGLNLTAADYVLHLDPWWNPAAEDQASDRAHRIGQQRPVTVYRFVSQGTIEERILALHAEKRDLADQILAGTDAGGKMSVGEVVELLREGR